MKPNAISISEQPTFEEELSPSVIRILSGALDAIAARGVKRLSMSDIIDASGVSRGTMYRYFSNKDQVLDAVSEFVCVGFENGVRDAGKDIADPIEQLKAVMEFYARYTEENSPSHVFEVEPGFHLAFFRSRFGRYKSAVRDALEPTFDHFDRQLGKPLNRDALVEVLVRLQLSTLLVPASGQWQQFWNDTAENVHAWILAIATTEI